MTRAIRRRRHTRALRLFQNCRAAFVCVPLLGWLPADAAVTADYADMSMEQLMQESVTSVSKRQTKLSASAAAISVISGDDIRRLGMSSLPEALRLAPGLDVARVDASHWAISSRGFNLSYANKLLVLMDGRSLYTPSFGGVPWAQQGAAMMEDVDRIEVIRGPGATLWGANAVNGVINITSKNSADTQGLLLSTTLGNEFQPLTSARYGGEINAQLHYRSYLQFSNREGLLDSAGNDAGDDWGSIRGGFRSDWQATTDDLVTIQGDLYTLRSRERVTTTQFTAPYAATNYVDNESHGGNLIGRWTRTISPDSHLSLQAYFDAFRIEGGANYEVRRTGDVELEYRFAAGVRNDILTGFGYRLSADRFDDNAFVTWSQNSRTLALYNAFIQDEITLVPDRLRLTLGTKFEHNDFTGWEIQPSARLLWTPDSRQTLWAAASHAVATPTRLYRDATVGSSVFPDPTGSLVEVQLRGANVDAEKLDAFEAGYRVEATPDLSFDLAGFYNIYDGIIGYPQGTPSPSANPVPHVVVPLDFANNISGHTYGAELAANWRPDERWRLTASYSWLEMNLKSGADTEAESPRQQAGIQSYVTLPWNLEFTTAAWFVDSISPRTLDGASVAVPAYIRADAGLIWRPRPDLEIGIFGQNLLDGAHPEFASKNTRAVTQVPRTVLGRVTWRF